MLEKYELCYSTINNHLSSNNPSNAGYSINSQCFNDDPAIKLQEKLNALNDHKI